jgi:Sec-independent protein secretion pathway component TatC
MSQRSSRRRQRHVLNRRWVLGMSASLLLVVVGVVGIVLTQADKLSDGWVYASFGLAVIGAVTAMIQTFIRDKAGDDIDEAKL